MHGVFFTNNEECAKRNANGAAMPLMPEEERDQDVRDRGHPTSQKLTVQWPLIVSLVKIN